MTGSAIICLFTVFVVCKGVPPPPPGEVNTYFQYRTEDDDATLELKHLYVAKDGIVHHNHPNNVEVITVAGTAHVSDLAMQKATKTITEMVRYMPDSVFARVVTSAGIGLFTKEEGLTVYPEMSKHADSPACHGKCSDSCHVTCIADGRKLSSIGGLTGHRSYVVDNNLLCNSHDGYHGTLNVLAHEFSHLIMSHLDHTWKERIYKAYSDIHAKGTWHLNSYAMRNHNEYFAEAAGAFFMFSHMHGPPGGMNMCGSTSRVCSSVSASRAFLHQHDPEIYAVLEYVFTANRPQLHVPLVPCM